MLPTTNCSLKAIADEYSGNVPFNAPHSFSEYSNSGSFQTFINSPAHYGNRQFITIGSTTYSVLTFEINSSWKVPNHVTSIRYLIIGGGGGSGVNGGGGGGAGGFLDGTLSVNPGTTYSFTIGQRGIGSSSGYVNGSPGTDTTAFGLTAYGGGGGASRDQAGPGGDGGSGGGGASWYSTYPSNGTPGSAKLYNGIPQGTNGGPGKYGDIRSSGGGGGGAGDNGGPGSSSGPGGYGGPGKISDITGEEIYYAGGGPGGSVPVGGLRDNGGGNGWRNYGGGGAGNNIYGTGSRNGINGVVIIRYALP